MAKKSVIAGEYTIGIDDKGHVDVLRVPSNSYRTMLQIAKEKGFPVDEKWNTQKTLVASLLPILETERQLSLEMLQSTGYPIRGLRS